MDHFSYNNGNLCAEDVSIEKLAEEVGTPFYCYSTATLERHYNVFARAFEGLDTLVCFAVKANSNIAVLKTLADQGAGADVVSGGELKRALVAGIPVDKIVFSGVGKTKEELTSALNAGVMQINVESVPELEALNEVAQSMGVQAPVSIRVNPDVDAKTHAKITTGLSENKFGIGIGEAQDVYASGREMAGIDLVGVAVHIGSQLLDLTPFKHAYTRVGDLVKTLRADGHDMRSLDLGGGLGIPYEGQETPSPEAYAEVVKEAVGDIGCRIMLEPGRVIAGNAGILVTRVVYVKEGPTRTFIIVDAAMNDLMRPSLYDAHHDIVPVVEPSPDARLIDVDIVGPICETGDTFGTKRPMPALKADDLLAVRTAGAYGAVMSGTYNTRPLVPEILIRGDDFTVVRRRLSVDDMLAMEALPDWED
ncbi:MAG: diaminopimelate decarboxylase [Rhodospirillales bacterium]